MHSHAILSLSMRITAILLCVGFLQVSAHTRAQSTISLSEKNISLDKLFDRIQQQTDFSIWYDRAVLANTHPVTVDWKEVTIDQALQSCLRGQSLQYEIVGNSIVIKQKVDSNNNSNNKSGTIDVRGRVVDEQGEPVVGASITVKDSRTVALTGADGTFVIHAIDENATIIFSGANVEMHEEKLIRRTECNVTLKKRINKLDEIQIIAYGTTTRRFNTGSVTGIKAEEIEKQPVSNPLAAMEGRMPGVYVQQGTGMPGGAYNIIIRGQNSLRNSALDNGNLPFYIIDGVPYTSSSLTSTTISNSNLRFGNPLSNINPADIESIEVLKDADATAIYGSRGANGVVLVTTKKGKAGKTKMDLNVSAGASTVERKLHLLQTSDYLAMRREAFTNDNVQPQPWNYDVNGTWDTTRNTDWQKTLIGGTANIFDVQGTVSGGTARTQFLFGGTYHRETTVFPGNFSYQKGSTHFNINHVSEDQRFRLFFNGSYLLAYNNLFSVDATGSILSLPPDAPKIYDSTGKLNWENSTWRNPFALFEKKYKNNSDNLLLNSLIAYEVVKGLDAKINLGYTNTNVRETSTNPLSSVNPAYWQFVKASAVFANSYIKSWIVEPQLEYKKDLEHARLNVLAGMTFQQNVQEGQTQNATGYSNDLLLENIQAAQQVSVLAYNYTKYRYNALFARINYQWKEKYIINLTGRRDGSSRFGPGKQFANFGAVGTAWIFSQEKFMQPVSPLISFGKLRASYGVTGNDQIQDYGYLETYSPTQYPYNSYPGLIPSRIANPLYSWETTKKMELALELGWLKDRIFFSAAGYHNRSSNQLVGYPLATVTGFSSLQYNLPAELQNDGLEFELNTVNVRNKNFSWTTNINLTIPHNKLIAYPHLESSAYANVYAIGQPLSIQKLYHYLRVDPTSGLYTFQDVDKDGAISYPNDLQFLKRTGQIYFGGFRNTFKYENLQLDIFFQFVKQNANSYFYTIGLPGSMYNQPVDILRRWQKQGDQSNVQKLTQDYSSPAYETFSQMQNSDYVITDASFIRLKNVSISYWLSNDVLRKAKLQGVRFYVQGQNLWTITHYQGLDPENQGTDYLPPLRTIVGGIQITF